ncbi:DUF1707 domain-containing protein [Kribbella qitaiheensis]|uniref:DUF1707 domain-containing protein n=1 Tax=Kribbella qitaiheensis TaxID=1544730 RepID=A0A7G6WZQ8_9ACTN|nr:DUF1707 domain-containing protein [Kribbella qitaiheensis]QNE19473.1 DUF1707 domain-containing protein [Kribbella qitaiheensis]
MADKAKPTANLSQLTGMAAAAGREAREAAARRKMQTIRLTDEERRLCSDDLAEQFAVGRLDVGELDQRLDLLQVAVTHRDLVPVFEGLPVPQLYIREPRKSGRWRWAAFIGAVWLALPFMLTGLVFLVFGREMTAAIFGVPSILWILATWRWARNGTRARTAPERRR